MYVSADQLQIREPWELTLKPNLDFRGEFTEIWGSDDFSRLTGLFFDPVKMNVSTTARAGTLRGLHAEPWNKFITVLEGRVLGIWVDLREGPLFGSSSILEIKKGTAVFVPQGVANGYLTLTDDVVYAYLVDGNWSPTANYVGINAMDEKLELPISWPKTELLLSPKDLSLPLLAEITPLKGGLVLFGSSGQLGEMMLRRFPSASTPTRGDVELAVQMEDFSHLIPPGSTIINCIAETRVDFCETSEGIQAATFSNVMVPKLLALAAEKTNSTLVHFSTDYVFSGDAKTAYKESDEIGPLSVYGWSKAMSEEVVSRNPRTYIVRTSWLLGQKSNFVKTLFAKARMGEEVDVVHDQRGTPTIVDDLVTFTDELLKKKPSFGTYHFTSNGRAASWYEIAQYIYELFGARTDLVRPVTSSAHAAAQNFKPARRPTMSELSIEKIRSLGLSRQSSWEEGLRKICFSVDLGQSTEPNRL